MPTPVPAPPPIAAEVIDVAKSFGAALALAEVSLSVRRGECLGVVGHNGAGKSTLMNILAGLLAPDRGEIRFNGANVTRSWSVRAARQSGIRCVFQELSLCANLSIAENARIAHPGIRGWGWRKRAAALLFGQLDEIFPGHELKPSDIVGDLSIGRRQAVEIARAFSETSEPVEIVILDEPTSSLDNIQAEQLLAFVRRFVARGKSCILITHKLNEVLSVSDRAVVMKDGRILADAPTSSFSHASLVAAMGHVEGARAAGPGAAKPDAQGAPRVRAGALAARPGEIIGLAGLAGHGQTAMLLKLHDSVAKVAFIAGDRQTDGILPLWSIERNISIRSLAALSRGPLVDGLRERALAETWRKALSLKTPSMAQPILSLSGGNQQKALFARALGSNAEVILMDDPMRGVDIGTKREVYELIAAQAAGGRTFLWYTTEFDELFHCHRVYVFHEGAIVGEISAADLSEERVLNMSFHDAGAMRA